MKKLIVLLSILISTYCCSGQHRKHVLGTTFLTWPPIYSCLYCNREVSPNYLLPIEYDTMKIPEIIDVWDEKSNTTVKRTMYWNGYSTLIRHLSELGMNDDSFFIAKWNEVDTTCISSEIALNKSIDIGTKWLATHKPGIYWLTKEDWMSTNGFMGHKGKDQNYAHGGRFSDSILKADKWYKIVYNLTSPLMQ